VIGFEPVIAIAGSQRGWASELVRFLSDFGGARLKGTVLTATEALQTEYEVLLIDDITSFLSPRLVDRIQKSGRKVVGIFDPESGDLGRERLLTLAVDGLAPADGGAETILEIVATVAFDGLPRSRVDVARVREQTRLGRITMVAGGDMAGDVAVILAGAFQARQRVSMVIEVDTITPMLAQRFSLPVVPNLLTALDAHLLLRGDVRDSFMAGPYGVTLLTGLPDPTDWHTVQAEEMVDLVETISVMHDELILKASPYLEEPGPAKAREGRFDANRALLGMAAEVVCLAEPTPVGLSRTLAWTTRARSLTAAPVHIVFESRNLTKFQRGELSDELLRNLAPDSITWLPVDTGLERAVWNGTPAPKGSFVRTVERLGGALESSADREAS
jgi:MinD-like ATPase involved in chromosome partitioning or flagellar assembly